MIVAIAIALGLLFYVATADAHLVVQSKPKMTTEQLHKTQTKNLKHAEYVCRKGARAHKRWACWAASSVVRKNGQGWLRREWLETRPRPVIGHLALWLCIHGGEASWSNPGVTWYGAPSQYYGGLQMTYRWLGLIPGYAHHLSPQEQMSAAETGYRLSGYSQAWLRGQWPQTSLSCLHLA